MPLKLSKSQPPSEVLEEELEISLEEEYNPHDALKIPPMPDQDQYIYRWIRFRVSGEDDVTNLSARLREGWVFVKEEDVPPEYVLPAISTKISVLSGIAINGDLALAKLPRRKAEAIRRWAEDKAIAAESAFNNRMMVTEVNGQVVRLQNDGNRTVTRGRRPGFG